MKLITNSAKALAILLLFGTGSAMAQDDDGGPLTQGEDAKYMRVTHVAYKPGMRADALAIISDHFMPAGEAAGTQKPFAFHYQTGEWHASFWWDMEGGMKDLEWFRSPDNVKFMEALAAQEGGMEAAQALWAKYRSMIARSEVQVGHYHDGGDDEDD